MQLLDEHLARLVESADIDDDGFFDLLVFSDRDGQPNLAYALGDGLGGFGPVIAGAVRGISVTSLW